MKQSKVLYDSLASPDDSRSELPSSPTPGSWAQFHEFTNTFWAYEILATITSLATLGAIFGILKHYNSTEVNKWNHSWALNSLVQLLATVCQIAMTFLVASCISQLKWLWYKDSRKLADLDTFDQCSRGPFGSLRLLFSRPVEFLGAFGAILIIFSLAFHTLIQNAISTKSGLFVFDSEDIEMKAIYPQGNNYSFALDYSTGNALGDQGPQLDMVADINYGMFFSISDRDTQFPLTVADCYYGNCTWDHIQTLSVCAKCADISSGIGEMNDYYTLYGTTLSMSREIGLITSLGSTFYPDPKVLPDIGPLIVHFTAMVRATINDQPVGIDCALYWCVLDSADVTMSNFNVTSETDTVWTNLSVSAQTTYRQTEDVILTPPTCYNEIAKEVSDTTQCTKTVSSKAQLALQNFLIGDITGFTGFANKNLSTDGWSISNEFVQLLYSSLDTTNILDTYTDIMLNIGHMMKTNIQQTVQGGYSVSLGTMYSWTTLFNIRWDYLIAPTILVVATTLFLLITIFKSWGYVKWKSSLLPLLFHPLAERPDIPLHKWSDMKSRAKAMEVRLETAHFGFQYVSPCASAVSCPETPSLPTHISTR